jgi:hypothetical protein
VCFIAPGALGITFVARGLKGSAQAPGGTWLVMYILLVIVCLDIGKRLFVKAKRLRQIQAADARRLDARRPILLLRSSTTISHRSSGDPMSGTGASGVRPICRSRSKRHWRAHCGCTGQSSLSVARARRYPQLAPPASTSQTTNGWRESPHLWRNASAWL